MSDNSMFLYAGDYDSVDDAKADLKALKELHREHLVGTYDAAVITKDEEGKVKIVDKTEKPTQHGGWAGLAVGAAIGVIFPPSILVSGLVGAGAGAFIGHLHGGMSRSDLKEIGEMLAVELFERLEIGLSVVDAVVVACVQEHRVVAQFGLPFALFETPVAFLVIGPERHKFVSNDSGNPPLLCCTLVFMLRATVSSNATNVDSSREAFHPPVARFP